MPYTKYAVRENLRERCGKMVTIQNVVVESDRIDENKIAKRAKENKVQTGRPSNCPQKGG